MKRMIETQKLLAACYVSVALVLGSIVLTSCGDEDPDQRDRFGRIQGTVLLPGGLAAAVEPAVGVTVRLQGGDYNQTDITDANGDYGFDQVPIREMTLSMTPGPCLADTQFTLMAVAEDTVTVDVTLMADLAGGCIPLPFAGASRMEIDAASNRAVLLYDREIRPEPAIVVVDLQTGASESAIFPDLTDVYDLDFVSSDIVVFNCLKPSSGYHLRFWNISTMMLHRSDVFYTVTPGQISGKVRVTPDGGDVFVTHQTRNGSVFDGQIYCLIISQGVYRDADNNSLDGQFAFDSSLVGNSVNWPYAMGIDENTGELLVGNYRDTVVVAISMGFWGSFNRSANLTAPLPGVRKLVMGAGIPGFAPWFWGFSEDRGIAAWPGSAQGPMLSYESGGTTYAMRHIEPGVTLSSPEHHLAFHSARGSWFTLVRDPARPQGVREAVEERSLTTLQKLARFETQFVEIPEAEPRAFAVNTQTSTLYVAYDNKPVLEVFNLPSNP